ncbi:MAG: class I SAM-dependent methyltransferase [Chitinophagales bacterium]|nr:class I SAM-dependent methyltransferase [Chitinophagales bacterium]
MGKIVYATLSPPEKVEKYQTIIRDKEWQSIVHAVPAKSTFLDVGCGAGYHMFLAHRDRQCRCFGIDPQPGAHGVGRYQKHFGVEGEIIKANSENLPFPDEHFDVVFCAHVLEHVNDEHRTLQEIHRVAKKNGTIIIGVPTASMAFIHLISDILFTTHIKIYEFIRNIFSKEAFHKLADIFTVPSHSYPRARTVCYDLQHYRISNWQRLISTYFSIRELIKPGLYPFPDYPQLFPFHKSIIGSSSVFFICNKKIHS